MNRILILATAIAFAETSAFGQTASPPAAPPSVNPSAPASPEPAPTQAAAPGSEAVLDTVVVKDLPVEQVATPTRPINSIYGIEATPLDTPRSIAEVSHAELENQPIKQFADFAKFSPGISPSFSLGQAAAPIIRGATGETFYNGFAPFSGSNAHPLNLNNVETAEIVRGPASVIFGPTANTSGFVNFTTKQPYFDQLRGEVNFELGRLNTGGSQNSYLDPTWQLDTGGPLIKDKLAFRLSYQQKEAETYYQAGPSGESRNNFASFYGALAWKPTKDLDVNLNVGYDTYDWLPIRGWNRPTQELIDDGLYSAGEATPVFRSSAGQLYEIGANGKPVAEAFNSQNRQLLAQPQIALAANTGTNPNSPSTLAGFVLKPQNTTLKKIYGYTQFASDQDGVQAQNFLANFDVNYKVCDDFKIVNKSMYNHWYNNTINMGFQYATTTTADVVENRTELQGKKTWDLFGLSIEHESNSGLALRYQDATGYTTVNKFLTGAYNLDNPNERNWSTLFGGGPIPYYNNAAGNKAVYYAGKYNQYFATAGPNVPIQGTNTYAEFGGSLPGNSYQSTTSDAQQGSVALYTQNNFKFDEHWGLNVGGRVTFVNTEISNPLIDPLNSKDSYGDQTWDVLPSVTSSLIYKPVPWVTTYATYDYTVSPPAATFTGNVGWQTGNQLGGAAFHRPATLYEAGAKFEVLPGKLFTEVAGYYQQRITSSNGVAIVGQEARGVELGLTYQPDEHWSVRANYTWMEVNYQQFRRAGYSNAGFNDDGTTVFNDPLNALNAKPPGNDRVPLPKNTFNAYVTYKFNFGLGFEAGTQVYGSYPTYYEPNSPVIPVQYNIDMAVFYARPTWDVRIDFLNVTDQRNFVPSIADSTGADFITQSQPMGVEAKIRYRF